MNLISFGSPAWLALIPVFLLLSRHWSAAGLLRTWRWPVWLAGLVLFADPQLRVQDGSVELFVLMDNSDSVWEEVSRGRGEWLGLLEKSRPQSDRLRIVDFAAEVLIHDPAEGRRYEGSRRETRLRLAIEHSLATPSEAGSRRLLVFSDGQSTDDLSALPVALAKAGTSLDHRLVLPESGGDFRLTNLQTPPRVSVGNSFVAEFTAEGPADGPRGFEIRSGATLLGRGEMMFRRGRGIQRVILPPPARGAQRIQVMLDPKEDPRPLNNAMDAWVSSEQEGALLLLSHIANDPLAKLLEQAGHTVITLDPGAMTLHPAQLGGVRGVVFNNVAAGSVGGDFLKALPFFVSNQGGGLLMLGGRNSFGSGGYFESPLDPLLPVSMELKNDHVKLRTTLAVLLDRSGSMSATTADGSTKMDLANIGTAKAIELLGPSDSVTVFAIDSAPHKIVPLRQINKDASRLGDVVRGIESSGGGIYVYEALKAGWEEIRSARAGAKHMILFSDAADSEEPGDYVNLLSEIRAAGGTVSVIGLGTPTDTDAELLRDVAKLGGGRIFFTDNASELPGLFAQETIAVARSTFVTDPTKTVATGGWVEVSQVAPSWPSEVAGFNLSYARPGATVSLRTADSYEAPLLAHWQRGAGRSAAVSFPLSGEKSETARTWPGLAPFLRALLGWLVPQDHTDGLTVRTSVDGGDLVVEFFHESTKLSDISKTPPRLLLANKVKDGKEIPWTRSRPGRFEARIPFGSEQFLNGAVLAAGAALPFGPVSPGQNPEWKSDDTRTSQLRALSQNSGGRELTDLSKAWDVPRREEFRSMESHALPAWLGLFLVCVLAERLGWRLSRAPGVPRTSRKRQEKQNPQAHTQRRTAPQKPPVQGPKAEVHGVENEAANVRRKRFSEAKVDRHHD